MTPPVAPTPPQSEQLARPSAAIVAAAHTESVLNELGSKMVALASAVVFGYLTYLEVRSATPSNVRLVVLAVPTFFSVAMLSTDAFVGLVSRLAPFIPSKWRGGDR